MKQYESVKTGNLLKVMEKMFYWRGNYFSGLVDTETMAGYDNPEDSFANHVGIESCIDKGLIRERK